MTDKHEGEAGATGGHKTGPRLSWMTGNEAIKMAVTFVMAATGALLGASYMIGVQFTSVNNRIAANAAAAKSVKQDVQLVSTDLATLQTDVGLLKDDINKQTNTLRGVFSKQYGLLKDLVTSHVGEFGRFSARMDEATKWMISQQHKDSLRMREEWRDFQQRNGK